MGKLLVAVPTMGFEPTVFCLIPYEGIRFGHLRQGRRANQQDNGEAEETTTEINVHGRSPFKRKVIGPAFPGAAARDRSGKAHHRVRHPKRD